MSRVRTFAVRGLPDWVNPLLLLPPERRGCERTVRITRRGDVTRFVVKDVRTRPTLKLRRA